MQITLNGFRKLVLSFILIIFIIPTSLAAEEEKGFWSSAGDFAVSVGGDVIGDLAGTAIDAGINAAKGGIMNALGLGGNNSSFNDAFDAIGNGGGAGTVPEGKFELPSASKYETIAQTTSLRDFIQKVLNFALTFLGIIAIVAIIYAGYLYILSGGDESNTDNAKKIVMYVVVGILVVTVSYALVNTVLTQTITGGDDRGEKKLGSSANNGGSNGGTSSLQNAGLNILSTDNGVTTIQTSLTPGTIIPAGTTLPNGVVLNQPITVGPGGIVSVPTAQISPTNSNNLTTNNLLSFQNGIIVKSEARDLGTAIIVSPEAAVQGIKLALSLQAMAQFDFGDGTSAILDSLQNPNATVTHSFGIGQKVYNIRVIAKGVDGKEYAFQKKLFIGGTEAKLRVSKTKAFMDEPLTLNGSASRVDLGAIKAYKWECTGATGCFSSGDVKGPVITGTFDAPGKYKVTLTVENTVGTSDSASAEFTIYDTELKANFKAETTNNIKRPYEFVFDAEESLNALGENNGLRYEWDFNGVSRNSTNPTVQFNFNSYGKKTIKLRVRQTLFGRTLTSPWKTKTADIPRELKPNIKIIQ